MDSKEERQVRRELASKLRRHDVPEVIWRELKSADLVDGAIRARSALDGEGRQEAEGDLLKQAKRYLRVATSLGADDTTAVLPTVEAPARTEHPPRTPCERARCDALSLLLHRLAGRRPEVKAFRATYLPGSLLSSEDAWPFVESPALARLPLAFFAERGIPLLGHRACITRDGEKDRVAITWDGGRTEARVRRPTREEQLPDGSWQGRLPDDCRLEYPGRGGGVGRVAVWPGAVLWELARLSQQLARSYPWMPYQATAFILAGGMPVVPAVVTTVTVRHEEGFESTSIRLDAPSWVPAETALAAWRAEQSRRRGGRENRPLSEKNLAVFAYLVGKGADLHDGSGPAGEWPGWHQAMRAWNREYPEWLFRDVRHLAQAYTRARLSVAFGAAGIGRKGDAKGDAKTC